jgi:hypothetical protein
MLGGIIRIRTSTSLTPSGKVKVKTTVRAAPMLPALRTSSTFPVLPTTKKRRRKKR